MVRIVPITCQCAVIVGKQPKTHVWISRHFWTIEQIERNRLYESQKNHTQKLATCQWYSLQPSTTCFVHKKWRIILNPISHWHAWLYIWNYVLFCILSISFCDEHQKIALYFILCKNWNCDFHLSDSLLASIELLVIFSF